MDCLRRREIFWELGNICTEYAIRILWNNTHMAISVFPGTLCQEFKLHFFTFSTLNLLVVPPRWARLESIENRGHGDLRARGAPLKIGRRSSRKPSQNHGNRSRAEDDPYRSSSPAGCGRISQLFLFSRYINFENGVSSLCARGPLLQIKMLIIFDKCFPLLFVCFFFLNWMGWTKLWSLQSFCMNSWFRRFPLANP